MIKDSLSREQHKQLVSYRKCLEYLIDEYYVSKKFSLLSEEKRIFLIDSIKNNILKIKELITDKTFLNLLEFKSFKI